MSAGEVITGIAGGVGTAAVLYAVRLMRRLVNSVIEEVRGIVAAPGEVKELRAAVATNTEAIGHLSSALERIARLAESRQAGERPES